MSTAGLLKPWIPPKIVSFLKRLLKRDIYFSGNYKDWASAEKLSSGYTSKLILESVKHATLEVLSGNAAFERDSVLFKEQQFPFPLISALLRAAIENNNRLNVLDFGGSLGSSYFQCKAFLPEDIFLNWNIIEQPHFVACGRQFIQTEQLKFNFSIDEVIAESMPNVALLASVLQYLPEPYLILNELVKSPIKYLIIDRTPFSRYAQDVITIQHVPSSIYQASYPCRIFSKHTLLNRLLEKYDLISEFDNSERNAVAGDLQFCFSGMILRRK